MGIIDGIGEVFGGLWEIFCSAIELAVRSVVWVVKGVFNLLEAAASFVKSKLTKLRQAKKDGVTDIESRTTPANVLERIIDDIKKRESEYGPVIDLREIEEKVKNSDGMVDISGINLQGEEVLLDATFIEYEAKGKGDKQEKITKQPILL